MLIIRHRRRFYEPRLPHFIFVDGLYAGTMRDDEFTIKMPSGTYSLRIQFGGRLPLRLWNRLFDTNRSVDLSLSSTIRDLKITNNSDTTVEFHDSERLWNLLFDIDLIAWIVSFFVTFPPLYKIMSDAFFAIWLLRLLFIRRRYYKTAVVSDK